MAEHKQHGAGIYVVVALILGVITFVEFAIVEFEIAWLGTGATMFWLILLSVAKFWMVIWFFMHLKDDPKIFTGFFSSGMLIAMGTFVALSFMFVLPAAVAPVALAAEAPAAHGAADAHGAAPAAADDHGAALPADVAANIASDGASRPLEAQLDAPRPADPTLAVTPPAAAEGGYEVDVAAEGVPAASVATPAAAGSVAAQAAGGWDEQLGATTFTTMCAACHQATGAGIPGVFPPLAGHAGDVYAATGGIGGRTYLVDVLLYGLQGSISVDGLTYNGVMPGWQQLPDEQIAALINHVVAGFAGHDAPEGFAPVQASEVAAQRGQGLSSADVHTAREALGLE